VPRAETSDGTDLHYERTGAGAPVLLVMGLGMNATGWWRTVPVLAERFEVVSLDNRGCGRSDRPPGPYSMKRLAEDAAQVLDSAAIERAHVYGVSLGGMIAMELALAHPKRVERLVLAATTAGGANAAIPAPEVLKLVALRAQMTAEQAAWASVPINYSPRTRQLGAQRIAEDIEQRLRYPIHADGYAAQLAAGQGHDCGERLGALRAPTLIVQGEDDVLVPPENARRLAELIPHAELRLWPDAAHLLFTDEPQVDREVARWLA
jgi:3-oxoadipate enol-lactonase